MSNPLLRTFAVLMLSGLGASALAHPKLLSATPADRSEGAAPARIELHFSENLVSQFSGAKLSMTAMPGMEHPPMPVKATVSGSDDPKVMLITPAAPLAGGSYRVDWRAVSADTHPVTGSLTFKIR